MTEPPTPAALRKWRRRLADEQAEARVYRDLAARRTGEEREILLGLAVAEERHAAHWARLLGDHLKTEHDIDSDADELTELVESEAYEAMDS